MLCRAGRHAAPRAGARPVLDLCLARIVVGPQVVGAHRVQWAEALELVGDGETVPVVASHEKHAYRQVNTGVVARAYDVVELSDRLLVLEPPDHRSISLHAA